MTKKQSLYKAFRANDRARIEALRMDRERYVEALEALLLKCEDVALNRGDWGLCDCQANDLSEYQSQFLSDVLDNIRARATKRLSL